MSFSEYVKEAISSQTSFPPFELKIGNSVARWFEPDSGIAHISAEGGTPEDKNLARLAVREALVPFGYKMASYSFDWDKSDTKLIKEATWQDIEAKAKRLIDSQKVQVLRNGYNVVVGKVEGDHGDYQTEFNRDDPNSQAITTWQCECPWDQFAWQRTRQWKKYEGRPCAHVLATFWQSKTLPFDEDSQPGPSPLTPNPSAPAAPGTIGPGVPPGQGPRVFDPNIEPAQIAPGTYAPAPPGQQPEPASVIPPFPNDPAIQPLVNPVSVPGLKQPSPLNPIQNPSTFSKVAAENDTFVNGEMVMNMNDEWGTAVGIGGGDRMFIPKNSIGEVLGSDPLGMVNVYFAGPASTNSQLEPHGCTAWFFASEITKRPDVSAPGPAIRRRT